VQNVNVIDITLL